MITEINKAGQKFIRIHGDYPSTLKITKKAWIELKMELRSLGLLQMPTDPRRNPMFNGLRVVVDDTLAVPFVVVTPVSETYETDKD